MIYSMVGLMQLGLGATVIEASPLYNDGSQRIVQLDNRHDQRQREENDRHGREMRRHHHENDRVWHDRQGRENQRHENARRGFEYR